MKKKIGHIIPKFELAHKCAVIFISDTGSRSFGWATKYSDFDVHLIYVRNDLKFYLQLFLPDKETISEQYFFDDDPDEDGKSTKCEINVCAFDIRWFLKLYYKFNLQVIFTLESKNFIYPHEKYHKMLTEMAVNLRNEFSPKTVFLSLVELIRANMKKHIIGRKHVKVKAYIYVIWHLMMVSYALKRICDRMKYPPLSFDELFDDLDDCNEYIKTEISEILKRKRMSSENEKDRLLMGRRKVLEIWVLLRIRKYKWIIKKKLKKPDYPVRKKIINELLYRFLQIAHEKI